jgi:hypothetical protein
VHGYLRLDTSMSRLGRTVNSQLPRSAEAALPARRITDGFKKCQSKSTPAIIRSTAL